VRPYLKTKHKQKGWGSGSSGTAVKQEALDSIPSTAKTQKTNKKE
jgi:hypothetical protein